MILFLRRCIGYSFLLIVGGIITAKILHWIFNFSWEISMFINSLMYVVIGLVYLRKAFVVKQYSSLFLLSGLFILVMSFIPYFPGKQVVAVVALLGPILLPALLSSKEII
ncbi:membrane hypothetical protein [Tenacibaculum litopenaei]|uniref:hypothetical protein n=1 Tax=Tenacibaculum litopenaei TaxID=396016 RepID=UPI0038966719